ncbi:MAG: transcription antitermination factor NusB, partial [Promethearchaeota archaeon]
MLALMATATCSSPAWRSATLFDRGNIQQNIKKQCSDIEMTTQVEKAREISLKVLDDYELTGKSVRFLLRQLEPRFQENPSLRVPVLMRVIGVVKFLNTIDFIIVRALGQKKLSNLSAHKRSVLRLVTYELRWLKEKPNQASFYEDLFTGISRYSQRVLDFDLLSSLNGLNE